MKFRTYALAALASLGMISAASAVPISGQISVNGYAQSNSASGMGAATGISFANATGTSVTGSSGLLSSYGGGTGTFAAIGTCASTAGCGVIQNITSFATSAPITSFLTLNTNDGVAISFDLTSISSVNHTQDSAGGSLTFTALGTIHETGFTDTSGQFILTAQGNNITSFSATTLSAGTSVPEPMSLALLGGALATVGLVRRKRS